jgi:carbamoyltransferase
MSTKYILGISAFYHDSSACLFKDDELLFACEEERFTGIKHDSSFPTNTIEYIFNKYNLTYDDIHMVCYYENLEKKKERVLNNIKKQILFNPSYSTLSYLKVKKTINQVEKYLKPFKNRVFYSEHHLSHQYYSFYTSDFDDSVCLSVDGVGEIDTLGLGFADNSGIVYKSLSKYPHSLGLFYSAMTSFLGFKPNEGEYKVMGLASYGENSIFINKVKQLIKYENNELICDLDKFCWDRSHTKMFTYSLSKFLNIEPRVGNEPITQNHKNLAYAVQKTYQDILFKIITDNQLKESNLCLSGGSAYNGTANGKLKKVTKIKDLWIPVAPSDAGSSIGACLHYLSKNKLIDKKITKTPFLGPEYDIRSFMDIFNYVQSNEVTYYENDEELFNYVANQLYKGKVVGWFQGRSEFGARALGNRSILGSPIVKGMRDKINKVIKKREGFRPFAPMVIKEKQDTFFEMDMDIPYMNQVVRVKSKYIKKLTEVTHVDGTARVQTVYSDNKIHKLLLKFEEYSGYPILLNTSFNIKDKTMVLTPNDAINTFYETEMDILVLGNYVIIK